MKKNFALALAFTVVLGSTTPVFAFTRDGGDSPIDRIVHILKKLLKPWVNGEIETPHP